MAYHRYDNISARPTGIDVKKYAGVKDLTIKDWIIELEIRALILRSVEVGQTHLINDLFEVIKNNQFYTKRFFINIFNNNRCNIDLYNTEKAQITKIKWRKIGNNGNSFLWNGKFYSFNEGDPKQFINKPVQLISSILDKYHKDKFKGTSINIITRSEFIHSIERNIKTYQESVNITDELLNSKRKDFSKKEKDAILKATELFITDGECQHALLEVDLSNSNEKIVKDFTKLLSSLSTKGNLSTHSKALTTKSWNKTVRPKLIEHKIIEYLDMLIDSKINSVDLRFKDYDEILFNDFDSDYDKTRKTTDPLAKKMISPQEIKALYSLL